MVYLDTVNIKNLINEVQLYGIVTNSIIAKNIIRLYSDCLVIISQKEQS